MKIFEEQDNRYHIWNNGSIQQAFYRATLSPPFFFCSGKIIDEKKDPPLPPRPWLPWQLLGCKRNFSYMTLAIPWQFEP